MRKKKHESINNILFNTHPNYKITGLTHTEIKQIEAKEKNETKEDSE